MPIVQMSADVMVIGGGLWGDPLLCALLDDTYVFDKALSAQEISALMQTGDIHSLQNPAAATKPDNDYIPTTLATTTVTTVPTEQPADKPYAPFGLPVWGFGVCMGVLALIILVTVIVNANELRRRHPAGMMIDDEPELSIKELAEKQSEEQRERFLTEEQRQKEVQSKQEGGADE